MKSMLGQCSASESTAVLAYAERMEIALVILFGAGALWLKLTTEDQRKAVLGYLIALAVVASIVSLLTGQGPNSAYGFSSSPVQYASQSVPSVC